FTEKFTDWSQPETVQIWADIMLENMDALLATLLKKELLRFRANADITVKNTERIVSINAYGGPRLAVVEMGDRPKFKSWVAASARATATQIGNAQPRGGLKTVEPSSIDGHLPAPVEDIVVKMNAYGRWRYAEVQTGEKWRFKQWLPDEAAAAE